MRDARRRMTLLLLAALAAGVWPARAGAAPDTAPTAASAPSEENADVRKVETFIVDPAKSLAAPAWLTHHIAAFRRDNKLTPETRLRVEVEEYFEISINGTKKELRAIAVLNDQDKLDGPESIYFRWRGVRRTTTYKNGVKHGPETTFEDGRIGSVTPWVDGKIVGLRKVFYASGKLASETPFVDGLESGESRAFDPDGSVIRVTPLKDGKREGDMIDFWPGTTQRKKVVPYAAGKIQGTVREFYLNGKLKREIPFKDGLMHGVGRSFDADEKLTATTCYLRGDEVTPAEYEKKK